MRRSDLGALILERGGPISFAVTLALIAVLPNVGFLERRPDQQILLLANPPWQVPPLPVAIMLVLVAAVATSLVSAGIASRAWRESRLTAVFMALFVAWIVAPMLLVGTAALSGERIVTMQWCIDGCDAAALDTSNIAASLGAQIQGAIISAAGIVPWSVAAVLAYVARRLDRGGSPTAAATALVVAFGAFNLLPVAMAPVPFVTLGIGVVVWSWLLGRQDRYREAKQALIVLRRSDCTAHRAAIRSVPVAAREERPDDARIGVSRARSMSGSTRGLSALVRAPALVIAVVVLVLGGSYAAALVAPVGTPAPTGALTGLGLAESTWCIDHRIFVFDSARELGLQDPPIAFRRDLDVISGPDFSPDREMREWSQADPTGVARACEAGYEAAVMSAPVGALPGLTSSESGWCISNLRSVLEAERGLGLPDALPLHVLDDLAALDGPEYPGPEARDWSRADPTGFNRACKKASEEWLPHLP